MSISYSLELPTTRVDDPAEFVSGEAVMQVAAAAEAAGFSGVHVTDHPAGDARWLDAGGHHALDPFVALSFAAAATRELRLLTYVYIAAYRNPFLGAKAVLSLDVLSGGRVTLGTAAGYLKPEFAALGVDFEARNDLFDENLEVMKRAWSGDDVAHEGRHFTARGVRMRPTPVQQPHPPIWIGGQQRPLGAARGLVGPGLGTVQHLRIRAGIVHGGDRRRRAARVAHRRRPEVRGRDRPHRAARHLLLRRPGRRRGPTARRAPGRGRTPRRRRGHLDRGRARRRRPPRAPRPDHPLRRRGRRRLTPAVEHPPTSTSRRAPGGAP